LPPFCFKPSLELGAPSPQKGIFLIRPGAVTVAARQIVVAYEEGVCPIIQQMGLIDDKSTKGKISRYDPFQMDFQSKF
jgi:hypothetical protein